MLYGREHVTHDISPSFFLATRIVYVWAKPFPGSGILNRLEKRDEPEVKTHV